MIDLSTCKFLVWGFGYSNRYSTHTHIHHAFFRALKFMFPDRVDWNDDSYYGANPLWVTHKNKIIITNYDCVSSLNITDDNFYIVHGLNDHKEVLQRFEGKKNYLSWNVFIDTSRAFAKQYGIPLTEHIEIAQDFILYPNERHCEFRWATDLLPHEIEANKPTELLSLKNKVINYVGTLWHVNEKEIGDFRRAAVEDGIEFKHIGAGQNGIVSIEENVRLVRESWMAPAISGSHHLTEGYAPCRIFKNISYGQMGITNSKRVNDIFGGRLIFHPDPYKLYYQAKYYLDGMDIKELHSLMDFVKENHTYINRINCIIEAIKIL